jgi:hypothetical protein
MSTPAKSALAERGIDRKAVSVVMIDGTVSVRLLRREDPAAGEARPDRASLLEKTIYVGGAGHL